VLPLVPSYITFVTGMTLDELTTGGRRAARRRTALHAGLFVLGFGLVFVALGATATALGATLRRSLPLMQQIGGIIIVALGLYLIGLLRLTWLMRERRVLIASKPVGLAGSVLVGIAFGAGWTPCVGPVLASILLYAGMKASMAKGMLLLGGYALGLGVPFFAAAVGFNWYLAALDDCYAGCVRSRLPRVSFSLRWACCCSRGASTQCPAFSLDSGSSSALNEDQPDQREVLPALR
jgi:cytochrome c-type biogenesis protein